MKFTFSQTLKYGKPSGRFHVGIPSLRRYDLLDRCLAAVLQSTLQPASILVLDNGGKWEPNTFKDKVKIVTPGYNLGVPASWNFIQRYYGDEDVYILNDDIFVQPKTFETCQQMPGWLVTGYQFGCFCVRNLCRQAVGQFDEDLWPMYWEDYDYITRMCLEMIDPRNTDQALPYHTSIGGIISAENIPDARPENFESGAKSEQPWMYKFKQRIAHRYNRKWGNNECGKPAFDRAYGGEANYTDPLMDQFTDLRDNPNYTELMDLIYEYCSSCSSAVEVVAPGDPGIISSAILNAGIEEVTFFAPSRNPEWDIIPCLARKSTHHFDVRTSFLPGVEIPECDILVVGDVDRAYKDSFCAQHNKAARYFVVMGDFPPPGGLFICDSDGNPTWELLFKGNGCTIYGVYKGHQHEAL